jgi:heme/copper-type cytochrome/quinol oxidase subunit 2
MMTEKPHAPGKLTDIIALMILVVGGIVGVMVGFLVGAAVSYGKRNRQDHL